MAVHASNLRPRIERSVGGGASLAPASLAQASLAQASLAPASLAPASLAPAALLALAGCAVAPQANQNVICSAPGLAVDIGFAAAGRHDCVLAPNGDIIVSVDHEPVLEEGINPSPWFAFRITSAAARRLKLTLDYTNYEHRYAPYISADGRTWTQLGAEQVALNAKKTRATLNLDLPRGQLFVAGQPLSSAGAAVAFTRNLLKGRGFDETRYGTSLHGQTLVGFVGGEGENMIVALTRQHPPETTGEEAFRAFVERLTGRNDAAAKAFRANHRIVLAPMPNPDGVDGGHWRLNGGGVDLNRDWGDFTQPETKALSKLILKEAQGRRVVSMMDFHSTSKTVIYAPPLTAATPTISLLPFMEERFKAELSMAPEWSYGHNANGGTSKGWALEALKAPGITVELWDQIPLAEARKLGASAADALISYTGDALP